MGSTETPSFDEAKLEAFMGQAVTDMGAAINGVLLHDRRASWASGRRWPAPAR